MAGNYHELPGRLRLLVEAAKATGREVEIWDRQERVVSFAENGCRIFVLGDKLPLNQLTGVIAKDKWLTNRVLKQAGIKAPRGLICQTLKEGTDGIKKLKLSFPLVVKPHDQSCGEAVTANIENNRELRLALKQVFRKYPKAIIEEYFPGKDYRLLVLDGKVIAACERIRPFVIGNGQATVGELIKKRNQLKRKKILVDQEVRRNLAKQKTSLAAIVPKGKKVLLRENANVSTGGLVRDVTDIAAGRFRKLAAKAAASLGLRFAGVDLLTRDIRKEGGDYRIIEVNHKPHFDLHEFPDYGRRRNVSRQILEAFFRLEKIKSFSQP